MTRGHERLADPSGKGLDGAELRFLQTTGIAYFVRARLRWIESLTELFAWTDAGSFGRSASGQRGDFRAGRRAACGRFHQQEVRQSSAFSLTVNSPDLHD